MDDIKLPPFLSFPDPDDALFTQKQMREYARAAVVADRERMAVVKELTPEQEREAFEAWYERDGVKVHKSATYTGYYRPSIQDAWQAWQARAALAKGPK